MKKFLAATIICLCISAIAYGQKLTKKQAREIMGTALACLKNSDSTSFVKLWYLDGTAAPYHKKPFTETTALSYFHYLRGFVDTALNKNLKIDNIEISKVDAEQQALNFGKYNIRIWFKYTEKYYKGFGFFVDYINDKWVVKYIPDTSTWNRG